MSDKLLKIVDEQKETLETMLNLVESSGDGLCTMIQLLEVSLYKAENAPDCATIKKH